MRVGRCVDHRRAEISGADSIAGKGADLNLRYGVGAAPYAPEMDCARLYRAFEADLSEGQKRGG